MDGVVGKGLRRLILVLMLGCIEVDAECRSRYPQYKSPRVEVDIHSELLETG